MGPPLAHSMEQLEGLLQVTWQSPLHFTLQLEKFSQSTVLRGPTVAVQLLPLLQLYLQSALQSTSQVLWLEQLAWQRSPQLTLQVWLLPQS